MKNFVSRPQPAMNFAIAAGRAGMGFAAVLPSRLQARLKPPSP